MEQGEADRREAAAPPQARLVDPHQAPSRGPNPRLGNVQFSIDSKLRGCDAVSLRVEDVAPHGQTVDRAMVRQKKTGQPVRFELTELTREAIDIHIKAAGKKPGQFLFAAVAGVTGLSRPGNMLGCYRGGSRVSDWPRVFSAHTTLIYRRTGNLRAVQLLLGHSKIESTVRYLGTEVDDALAIAEQVDV